VSQVIQNLVINAIQAMPGGGLVSIHAENRVIGEGGELPLAEGRYVQVEVRDTGTGIEPGNLSKIFDPFFTTKADGNGLGLSNCYSIVRNHSGHITVQSRLNEGTSFHVYLPASDAVSGPANGAREASARWKGRVLILEDDAEVMKIARMMFESQGMHAEIVPDGDRAVARYRAAMEEGVPYELVVLDLTVPGGRGGQQIIGELHEINPGVMAVVSSGYSDDPVMAHFEEYGFRGVLRKPYTITDIQELMGALFGRAPDGA